MAMPSTYPVFSPPSGKHRAVEPDTRDLPERIQLEARPDVAQACEAWQATRQAYARLVMKRRVLMTTGATLMCCAFTSVGWLFLENL